MANILMLLQEHYPKDTRVRKEVFALREKNHDVTIVCLREDEDSIYENINGVVIHRLNIAKKRASGLRYIFEYLTFFVLAFNKVRQLVRDKKFDIVHVHTIPDFLIFAAHPAKIKGAKLVLDMHEIMPEFFISKYRIKESHIIIWFLKFVERKSIEYADQVITINKQLKNRFSERSKPKSEIVEIMNTVSDEVMPRVQKQPSSKFIAVYHGTLTKLYNLEFAILAISRVIAKIPDFEFHIYGSGPEHENLTRLVSELKLGNVIFVHGKVSHELIPEILSKANVGILPIQKDIMSDMSFSNKLAEYVHNEIPVLSSDLSGIQQYFSQDMVYYFKSEDVDDFNKQLIRIIENPVERANYAMRASQANSIISWDVMKVRLQQLVENLTS